jgi:hypothetical protein
LFYLLIIRTILYNGSKRSEDDMKLKKVFLLITTLLGIVLTLTACSTKREANTKNHKVDIVTSTNIYGNIAEIS